MASLAMKKKTVMNIMITTNGDEIIYKAIRQIKGASHAYAWILFLSSSLFPIIAFSRTPAFN